MNLARFESGTRNLAEKSGNNLLNLLPKIGRNRFVVGAALAIGIFGMTQVARADSPFITYDIQPYGFSDVPNYCDDRTPQPTLTVSGYQETTTKRLENGRLELSFKTEATGSDSTGSSVTVSGDNTFNVRENENGNFKIDIKGSLDVAVLDGLPNEQRNDLNVTIQGDTDEGTSETRIRNNGDLECDIVPIR